MLHRWLFALLVVFMVSACSDDSGAPPPQVPPPGGNDDDEELVVASLENRAIGATESILVSFSKPMDGESLVIDGPLADHAELEWTADDALTLSPRGYWPPGKQQLILEGDAADGTALRRFEEDVEIASPFVTGQAASVVIGQSVFTVGTPRQSEEALYSDANTLDQPGSGVAYAPEKNLVFIADTQDSRILAFRGLPEMNNANADFVIGQDDFTHSSGATTQDRMRLPQGISANGGHLIVGDPDSNRVIIYPDVPEAGPGMASVVLGQPDFTSFETNCGPDGMNHVHGHFVTPSGRLIVADGVNNRLLVWNEIPSETRAPDAVIGQSSFNHCAANDANQNAVTDAGEMQGTSYTLQHPTDLWTDDERLVVVDNYNNRVLIWNSFPEEPMQPADIVLGQPDMNSIIANDDDGDGSEDAKPSARTLNYPWSVTVANGQLFVTDELNNRVLVWNQWPSESFQPADEVIGQASFEEALPNRGAATPDADTLSGPKGVRVIDDRLVITDTGNSRVLIFEAQ